MAALDSPAPRGDVSDVLTVLSAVEDMTATMTTIICRDTDWDAATVREVLSTDLFAWAQDMVRDVFPVVSEFDRERIRAALMDALGEA